MTKIEKIEVYTVRITYQEPIRISLGVSATNDEVIVKIRDDEGYEGWGEGSPSLKILGETAGTMVSASDVIGPLLIGQDPEMLNYNLKLVYEAIKGNTAVKAAYDMALYDLYTKRLKIPLHKFLGGSRDRVEVDHTIGIVKIQEAEKKAKLLVKEGFKRIKLKVGSEDDIDRVRAIRKVVGKETKMFIDANQAWSPDKAVRLIKRLEPYEIELVEQPVKAWDLSGMAFVRKKVDTPIMADESVHDAIDAMRVVKAEAADFINIKLMKCGGIREATRIADISEAAGIRNIVGCMLEGGISITAGVHFSCSTENVTFTDLDSDIGLIDNFVKNGPAVKEGYRIIPKGIGLGNLRIDKRRLKKVRVYTKLRTFSTF